MAKLQPLLWPMILSTNDPLVIVHRVTSCSLEAVILPIRSSCQMEVSACSTVKSFAVFVRSGFSLIALTQCSWKSLKSLLPKDLTMFSILRAWRSSTRCCGKSTTFFFFTSFISSPSLVLLRTFESFSPSLSLFLLDDMIGFFLIGDGDFSLAAISWAICVKRIFWWVQKSKTIFRQNLNLILAVVTFTFTIWTWYLDDGFFIKNNLMLSSVEFIFRDASIVSRFDVL